MSPISIIISQLGCLSSLCSCVSASAPPAHTYTQPVINTSSQRILLTYKLNQISFLLTSLPWFPFHSVPKPKSSPWPTRTCETCPHLLPPSSPSTLLLTHSAPAALGFSLYHDRLRQVSTSGPLHLQFPLPHMFFSQIPAHLQNFTPMFPGPLPMILTLSVLFLFRFFPIHYLINQILHLFIYLPVPSTRSAP